MTDRAAALPALAEAFRQYGFDGASLSLLSQATGLGKGSLYNFFPGGKDEMIDAVLADIDRWFCKTIFVPLERASDPAVAIIAMFEDVTAYFRSGARVCLVGWIGLGASSDAFAGKVKSYFSCWISSLARCLELGGVQPSQAAQLAEKTISGIQGAIVLAQALADEAAFTRIMLRLEAALLQAINAHSR